MIDKIKLLERLMACKAVTHNPKNVNKAVMIMHDFLVEHGVYCKLEEWNGRSILFASNKDTKHVDVLLNAHLDVVPADDHMFKLVNDNGILKGRGTQDCQAECTILADILCQSKDSATTIGAIFSTDEEAGGNTTAEMVKLGYSASKCVIIIDSGAYSIYYAQKGILGVKLTAHGKGGHASEPWSFDNPIDKLIDGYKIIRDSWEEFTGETWCNTMSPCIIKSGEVGNQIPDDAEMILNIRYISEEAKGCIIEKIKKATNIEAEIFADFNPVFVDENNEILTKLKDTMKKAFKLEDVPLLKMNGATDARHFTSLNVPIAIIGIEGGEPHSVDEWASLKNIEEYPDFLIKFINAI